MTQRITNGTDNASLVKLLLGEAQPYPVTNAFFGMCRMVADFDPAEKKNERTLRNKVVKSIEKRTDFAHGDWYAAALSRSNLPGGNDPLVRRTLPARTEGPSKDQRFSVDALDELSTDLRALLVDVVGFGYLALGLPVVVDADETGRGTQSVDEFRVRDVFVVQDGMSKAPAVVLRSGPCATRVGFSQHLTFAPL